MIKDLRELPPVIAPNKEKLEVLKESLRYSIIEDLVTSGTIDSAKIEQEIIKAMPNIDKTMLGVRLPIFKAEVENYTASLNSIRNKVELSSIVSQVVDSSLNFLLS